MFKLIFQNVQWHMLATALSLVVIVVCGSSYDMGRVWGCPLTRLALEGLIYVGVVELLFLLLQIQWRRRS